MSPPETTSTTPRGEQTRRSILDVATRRFADQGFRNTSVAAVARELGLAPSAVYFHFADKQALFVAAFDRDAARLCDDALDQPGPMDAAYWQEVVRRFVTRLATYPLVHRVLAGREPGLLARLVDGVVPQRIRQSLETSLRAGQESGDIAEDIDPRDTAIALEAIFTAVVITVVQVGGSGTSERVDALGRLVRAAITAKRSG
ncbi:TetR/AcrR family transcriptional regulator [Nocardia sp. NBC_00508]|uniref:TetR/AcrR family transcriptional regulator n=1 Tax=Nocardia sp. NBC_00508 TaxID=2975992 RepID=UPI002E7FDF3E|nr:TetR/AcrR family transcriptional regulator [Nocardia sp. NBC_00508]WUD63875.1 TetR/AcrR family transcriptional regulator [Nocardia sp. NBC_00508]